MTCAQYLELLAVRPDGILTPAEEQALEEHLIRCPECRAAESRLAAIHTAFADLEEIPAPEGFAQGVMDRIRAEKKVIPLFRRPQFRALAGLAACAVLAVGLYGAVQSQPHHDNVTLRIYTQDVIEEDLDAPEIAAYCDPGVPAEDGTNGMLQGTQKYAPDETAVRNGSAAPQAAPIVSPAVLMLDRMPEGAWELIPPETPVSPDGLPVTRELFEEIQRLAHEEEITASITTGWTDAEEFIIVVLEEIK